MRRGTFSRAVSPSTPTSVRDVVVQTISQIAGISISQVTDDFVPSAEVCRCVAMQVCVKTGRITVLNGHGSVTVKDIINQLS